MSIKSKAISLYAKRIKSSTNKMASNAISDQKKVFEKLISKGRRTKFGQDHHFKSINDYTSFAENVPIRNYENLRNYIDDILDGQKSILWPGQPKYFAKTSGTTSGVKYIPLSQAGIKYQIAAARNTILNYTAQTHTRVFEGKMIFISGSPELQIRSNIKTGRLSGIVNHEIPSWVKPYQLPSYKTNCISDWESKLDKIVEETIEQDLRLISGIPPWVQMYFERLLSKSGKKNIKALFPNLELFIHGGVNYKPYKKTMNELIGGKITTLETYPASEGFIAFQNDHQDENLLLNTNTGLYFEFVPADLIFNESPPRLSLSEVELNKDYAVIISSDSGLWAYNIGDTIRFKNLNPYKIMVSGRINHFISAFGEHVIAKEVEDAIRIISEDFNLKINEFTVAPQVNPPEGVLPYHEWFIEFDEIPKNIDIISVRLEDEIVRQNIYYRDLIEGQILQGLKITPIVKNGFIQYMKSKGKLGGQNKVPRLTNNRKFADDLLAYTV